MKQNAAVRAIPVSNGRDLNFEKHSEQRHSHDRILDFSCTPAALQTEANVGVWLVMVLRDALKISKR